MNEKGSEVDLRRVSKMRELCKVIVRRESPTPEDEDCVVQGASREPNELQPRGIRRIMMWGKESLS